MSWVTTTEEVASKSQEKVWRISQRLKTIGRDHAAAVTKSAASC